MDRNFSFVKYFFDHRLPVYLFIYLFFSLVLLFFRNSSGYTFGKKKKEKRVHFLDHFGSRSIRHAVPRIISKLAPGIFPFRYGRGVESGGRELLAIYLIGPTSIADRDGRVNWCTNENGLKIYIDRDNVNGNSLNNWSFDHPVLLHSLHFYSANESVFKRAFPLAVSLEILVFEDFSRARKILKIGVKLLIFGVSSYWQEKNFHPSLYKIFNRFSILGYIFI